MDLFSLVKIIFALYCLLCLLSFLSRSLRVSEQNYFAHLIHQLTHPWLSLFRRFLPKVWGFDVGGLVGAFVVKYIGYVLLFIFVYGSSNFISLFIFTLSDMVREIIQILFYVTFIYGVLSWIRLPYVALNQFISGLCEPLLQPIRQWIPSVARIDFSPLILFIILCMVNYLLRSVFAMS